MQRAATAGKPVRSTYENESSKFAKQTPTQPELPPQKEKPGPVVGLMRQNRALVHREWYWKA